MLCRAEPVCAAGPFWGEVAGFASGIACMCAVRHALGGGVSILPGARAPCLRFWYVPGAARCSPCRYGLPAGGTKHQARCTGLFGRGSTDPPCCEIRTPVPEFVPLNRTCHFITVSIFWTTFFDISSNDGTVGSSGPRATSHRVFALSMPSLILSMTGSLP